MLHVFFSTRDLCLISYQHNMCNMFDTTVAFSKVPFVDCSLCIFIYQENDSPDTENAKDKIHDSCSPEEACFM